MLAMQGNEAQGGRGGLEEEDEQGEQTDSSMVIKTYQILNRFWGECEYIPE